MKVRSQTSISSSQRNSVLMSECVLFLTCCCSLSVSNNVPSSSAAKLSLESLTWIMKSSVTYAGLEYATNDSKCADSLLKNLVFGYSEPGLYITDKIDIDIALPGHNLMHISRRRQAVWDIDLCLCNIHNAAVVDDIVRGGCYTWDWPHLLDQLSTRWCDLDRQIVDWLIGQITNGKKIWASYDG